MLDFGLDFLKSLGKKFLFIGVVFGGLYAALKLVFWIGPLYVFGFLYLVMGFMVAFETRETSRFDLLAWSMVVFWLPAVVIGVVRKVYFRGESLTAEVREKIAEEELDKMEGEK